MNRLSIGGLVLTGCCLVGCTTDHNPHRPYANAPRNVSLVVDEDSLATRDTVLRVQIAGENIDYMSISADSATTDTGWEHFYPVKIVNAPRQEEMFWVFGRFATAGGGTTGVYRDDIRLDFSAVIAGFDVFTSDTLYPNAPISFQVTAGEIGSAAVNFSTFLAEFELDSVAPGNFYGSTRVPAGVHDTAAYATAHFTDYAGNRAEPLRLDQRFVVLGEEVSPELITHLDLPGVECSAVWWHLGYCYLSDWEQSLHIINVTHPNSPILLKTISMGGTTYGSYAGDYYLYVADGDAGLAVVNLMPPDAAAVAARIPIAGQPRDVVLDGYLAYVSCKFTGLRIFDLTSAESPSQVSKLTLEGYGESVTYAGHRIYVSGQNGGAIIDVTDPETPRLISEFLVNGIPQASTYFGGYFYFTTEERGVVVHDVGDAENPQLAAEYPEYEDPFAIAVAAPYLLVGGNGVLWVLNLANPRALREVGRVEGLGEVRGMFVAGETVYLAERGGLSIVNLYGRGQ